MLRHKQQPKSLVLPSSNCPDIDELRKNVAQLSGENQRLKKRVADLERERLVTPIQEQLEKEEQRGEALQHHLFEIAEKEGPLSTRMDQIAQQLSPKQSKEVWWESDRYIRKTPAKTSEDD
jgi:chromosome segregation ATPase